MKPTCPECREPSDVLETQSAFPHFLLRLRCGHWIVEDPRTNEFVVTRPLP